MLDERQIRRDFRQVSNAEEVFEGVNAYFLDPAGRLAGLNATGRQLTDVRVLRHLTALQYLDLGNNGIIDPSPLGELAELQMVDLQLNQVSDMGFALRLRKLKYLDLRYNRIRVIPAAFAHRPIPIHSVFQFRRSGVFLDGNDLERPPMAVVRKGDEAVKHELRERLQNSP